MSTNSHLCPDSGAAPLPVRCVVSTWWPLALSWLLMAAEGPALSAVVARLADPEINLAAFGVVYSLALIIESPIIMLLSASTALSKDWDSYRKLHRFMMWLSAGLTALHILVAFTPLYDVLVVGLIRPPAEIVEPTRLGLMIMLPWTWAIAYRRFQQGVLIRFGHSRAVSLGTAVRLGTDATVLIGGYLLAARWGMAARVTGVVVASTALAASTTAEAIYAGLRVRPVLRRQVRSAPPVDEPLTAHAFLSFYTPLAMTSLLALVVQPVGSAALSRMPQALESLAVWPVLSGFVFLLRSAGMAYNEVVIALLDEPRSTRSLRRFAYLLAIVVTALLLTTAATPLAPLWFRRVSGLKPHLAALAHRGLWLALPWPALNVLYSWYQGAVVHSRRTRPITEAVVIYLLTSSAILWAGVAWSQIVGLYVGVVAFAAGATAQTLWLWHRSRRAVRAVEDRDAAAALIRASDIAVR
ncbi:MAG: hypothetical protein PVH80_02195 [Anaerolineae bacterium]